MKKTRLISLLLSVAMIPAVFFVGCKKKVPNDENTLQIYCANFGYGYDWLNSSIELFKETEWVKAKYPELNIPKISTDSDRSHAANLVMSGEKANTFDLLFACESVAGYIDKTYVDAEGVKRNYFEDLTELYEQKVPDNVPVDQQRTLYDKMDDALVQTQIKEKKEGGTAYYTVPWVSGYMGLLYNKTLVEKHLGVNYQLPRTTNELGQMAKDIKNAEGGPKVPFVSSSKAAYWTQVFMTLWAQYEGTTGYDRYWKGVNEYDELSTEIFSQKGRLRSLEAIEGLIGVGTGNNHEEIDTLEFTQAQSRFLLGEGYMMPNGDWFEYEMRSTADENPNDFEITYMKMPVISSIIEKCTTIDNDQELSLVIKAIDEGKSLEEAQAYVADLNETDYAKITEARKVMYCVEGHEGYIPYYATAKNLAKDFLLFLATDEACKAFMSATFGASTPYEYDISEKAPDIYNGFSAMQKDRIKMSLTGISLKPSTSFKLCYYGGLNNFAATNNIEIAFTAQNSADRKSAQTIWQDDINFYTKNSNQNWDFLLNRAGY